MVWQVYFLQYQIQQSTIRWTELRNEETYRKLQAPVDEDRSVNNNKVDIILKSLFICLVDFWNSLPFSTSQISQIVSLSVWLFVCFTTFSNRTTKSYDVNYIYYFLIITERFKNSFSRAAMEDLEAVIDSPETMEDLKPLHHKKKARTIMTQLPRWRERMRATRLEKI